MKKTRLFLAMSLIAATSSAQAAFWDSWFSDDAAEETAPAAPAVAPAPTPVAPAPTVEEAVKSTGSTAVEAAKSVATGLIPSLTSQLGVSEAQASGGMGALLQMAQGNLSGGEFSQLSQAIPGASDLLSAAPKLAEGGASAQLGNLLSQAGSAGQALGGLSKLTSQFEALGLSSGMISQFASIAMNYLQNGGTQGAAGLLQKGLGALLGGGA